MPTLSERIDALLDEADQLHAKIRALYKDVEKMDGIEAVEHLADVPGGLLNAENSAGRTVARLHIAHIDAKRGGM